MVISLPNESTTTRSHSVKSYANIAQILDVPNLIQSQLGSYDWFKSEGLDEVLKEVSPIVDYTAKKYELHFLISAHEPIYFSKM